MLHHLRLFRVALAALALSASASTFAQYPNRPITIIVPWGAGGGTDATARILASLLEQDLKQPVNVVNRTGGTGVVGHRRSCNPRPTATRSGSSRSRSA